MPAPADSDDGAIAVALRIADPILAARVAAALGREARIRIVADTDAAAHDADLVIADEPINGDRPVIAIVADDDDLAHWRGDIRAMLRPDFSATAIAAAVIAAAAGLVVLPPDLVEELGWRAPIGAGDDGDGDVGKIAEPIVLTPREEDVLRLLADGASNKAIARRLGISVHTAKFHVASLLAKLGASGRAGAIAAAIRRGLLML